MKKKILKFFRGIGILKLIDKLRFYYIYIYTYIKNHKYLQKNPDIKFPPAYFIYETYQLDYYGYYIRGNETAKWLISYIAKYKNTQNLNILDWGCGPGRTIRHFPELTDYKSKYFGTDYNADYINWCADNITNVNFSLNGLKPPLPFDDSFFDVIYGISIFTHLSEENHYAWYKELLRVLKKDGLLILTLAGNSFLSKLLDEEAEKFKRGELVVRSNTKEGHRTFASFHPEKFVRDLIGQHEVLEFVQGEIINNQPQQDLWIIKKI